MASTAVKINIKGIDQASNVFPKIASAAKRALGAIGAGLTIKGLAGMVRELGTISDISQAAGVAAEDITSMSGAMGILGIQGASMQSVAQAMQYMARSTGEVGKEGFKKVLDAVGQLPTKEERARAAMEVFGRSGRQMLPLIEAAAKNGADSFLDLADMFPSVSTSAADAGDAVSDSWDILWAGIKSTALKGIGAVCGYFDKNFAGGIRQFSAELAVLIEFTAKKAWTYLTNFVDVAQTKLKAFSEGVAGTFSAISSAVRESLAAAFTGDWSGVWDNFKDRLEEAWSGIGEVPDSVKDQIAEYDRQMIDRMSKIELKFKSAYKNAAVSLGEGGGSSKYDSSLATAARSSNVANKWISGGTYEALTMGLRAQMRRDDPQTKEIKKTNNILGKIYENMKKPSNVAVLDLEGA